MLVVLAGLTAEKALGHGDGLGPLLALGRGMLDGAPIGARLSGYTHRSTLVEQGRAGNTIFEPGGRTLFNVCGLYI